MNLSYYFFDRISIKNQSISGISIFCGGVIKMELLLSPSILGVTAVAFKGFSSSLTGFALKTGWIDAYGSDSPSTVGVQVKRLQLNYLQLAGVYYYLNC